MGVKHGHEVWAQIKGRETRMNFGGVEDFMRQSVLRRALEGTGDDGPCRRSDHQAAGDRHQ